MFCFVCSLEGDLVKKVVAKISELMNKRLPLDVGEHVIGVKQVAKSFKSLRTKRLFQCWDCGEWVELGSQHWQESYSIN
jgi:hypothetical protein